MDSFSHFFLWSGEKFSLRDLWGMCRREQSNCPWVSDPVRILPLSDFWCNRLVVRMSSFASLITLCWSVDTDFFFSFLSYLILSDNAHPFKKQHNRHSTTHLTPSYLLIETCPTPGWFVHLYGRVYKQYELHLIQLTQSKETNKQGRTTPWK